MLGPQPVLNGGGEHREHFLTLRPALPAWLFSRETAAVECVLLGRTRIIIHNAAHLDTWQVDAAVTSVYLLLRNSTEVYSLGATLSAELTNLVLSQHVALLRIKVEKK